MKLLNVDELEVGLEKLERAMRLAGKDKIETEKVCVTQALGRILAWDIFSEEDVPGFNRSTVDGYAVVSADTAGAGESIPAFLEVAGEVEMGKPVPWEIKRGQCAYVPTGGMVPGGADGVAMVEFCQDFGTDQVAVYSPLSWGHNVVMAADDVRKGEKILSRGRKIRPADMGLLCAVGKTSVEVYKPWKIYILSTGDEIVSPWQQPAAGQVRDVNTYSLLGQSLEYGFQVVGYEVVVDDEQVLREKVAKAMEVSDFVVISGGSSQGKKDATMSIIDDLSSTGAFTHGLAVKPGKPTILGFDEPSGAALIGLPGHPVAALLLFREMVGRMWERLTGMDDPDGSDGPNGSDGSGSSGSLGNPGGPESKFATVGIMAANVASSPGRKTFQLVKIDWESSDEETGLPAVVPVLGQSGLIKTVSRADGYIVIDLNDEGIGKGEKVKVYRL